MVLIWCQVDVNMHTCRFKDLGIEVYMSSTTDCVSGQLLVYNVCYLEIGSIGTGSVVTVFRVLF
jgi:hypothetical protein